MEKKIEPKDYKQRIVNSLKEKNVTLPCSRCASLNFRVIGEAVILCDKDFSSQKPEEVVEGTVILLTKYSYLETFELPAAIIVCSQCGFITLHALGSLDLL